MKPFTSKSAATLLALVAALLFSVSCKHKADLAGGWYYQGQPCRIVQDGNSLTFINERGEQSRGYLKNDTQVVAVDWEGGLGGDLADNGRRINWRNHTVWSRAK